MLVSPFVFPVSDLLANPGRIRNVEFAGSLVLASDQAELVEPVRGELRFEGVSDGVFAAGPVDTAMKLTCDLCLSDYVSQVAIEFSQLFTRELDEDGYRIGKNDTLDLEDSLRDEIFLTIPLVMRCREACLGLCSTCGNDLNTDPCGGHFDDAATPFAVLKDIVSD